MLKKSLQVNMNNEALAVSFIWKYRSAQSLGYILTNIVLNPWEMQNRSPEMQVSVSV